VEVAGKSLPVLTNLDKGRYGVLIFENLNKYLQMDKWNRELLDKYCREYSVGIVGFTPPGEESLVGAQLKGFPLFVHTNLRLKVSLLSALIVRPLFIYKTVEQPCEDDRPKSKIFYPIYTTLPSLLIHHCWLRFFIPLYTKYIPTHHDILNISI
jgi:hypothetical protein